MSSPTEPTNESTLRAEMDVLMKKKEALKNIMRDDASKKEKLKEEYAEVMSDLADVSRRLITLKKDTAMTPKLLNKNSAQAVSSVSPISFAAEIAQADPPPPSNLADVTLPSDLADDPPPPDLALPDGPPPSLQSSPSIDERPPPPEDDAPPPAPEEADLPPPPPPEEEPEVPQPSPRGKGNAEHNHPVTPPPEIESHSAFPGSTYEGWLVKKSDAHVKNPTRLYCVLNKDKLLYFESMESKKLSGDLSLSANSAVAKTDDSKIGFWVFPGGDENRVEFEAADTHLRNTWVSVLDKHIYSRVLSHAFDPKHTNDSSKGALIIKVFRISNLTNIKGLLSTGGSSRLVGKLPGLFATLKVGSQQLKTRIFDSGYRAVFNQTFVIPKSQWPQGSEVICEVTDQGSARSKSLGTINFPWPEEKKGGFYKGTFSFDKSGQSGGQLEVAVVDTGVLLDGVQLQTVLSPEPLTGIEQYIMGKQLGKGGCGTVYLAKHKLTNRAVAIKVVAKEKEFEVRTEMDVMQMLKHPNCVKLEEMIEMKTNIYMVMELMGEDLQHRIYEKYNGKVPEDVCRVWMKEMALALEYCHDIGVVHRDIKPENLMFASGSSELKLTDFGLATFKQAVMKDSCGTPPFMAPEMVTQKPYGKEVDMWALGVALFQTASGTMPFDQSTQELTFIAIKRASYIVRPEWNFSPELVHLLRCLFEVDAKIRLTASQMLEHPWIKGEPLGDYVVPGKEMYEALKIAQKPSSPAEQSMRRKLARQNSDP